MQQQADSNFVNFNQLAFQQVKPVKFTGISSSLPFNIIISQSQLLYFSGRCLILQNIKTSQQKVIWANHYEHSPQAIQHVKNAFQSHIVGIACQDNEGNHVVIILAINTAINNHEHFIDKERQNDKIHYLKGMDEDDIVLKLRFFQQGGLFVVVTGLIQQQQQVTLSNKTISVYSISSGDKLYSTSFISRHPIVETLRLNRESYICIMKNQPQQQQASQQQHSLLGIPLFESQKNKHPTYNFNINLLSESSLSIGNELTIKLQQDEYAIEIIFIQINHKMMLFILLNTGFVLGFGVDERGFHQSVRIDVRVNRGEHQRRVNKRMQKGRWQGRVEGMGNGEHNNKEGVLGSIKEDEQYYMPSCMSCSSNRVVIGYEGCAFIGVVQYSGVDHRQYKFWYIDDFFTSWPQIISIHQINFSQDGCHCSVLIQISNNSNQSHTKAKKSLQMNDDDDDDIQIIQLTQPKQLNCQFQHQHFNLLLIDFVSGLIQHSYHNEAIQETLTCSSLNGVVRCVEFSIKNNTVFVLMNDGRLCFCTINWGKDTQTQANPKNLNIPKSKQTQPTQQPPRQDLQKNDSLPQQMLYWTDKKGKPYLTISHPIIFQLVLIYQDSVRMHFYNFHQLFDSHYIIGLKNCKAASYSPLGDKLTLGTLGSVWIVDSYTYAVIKKVNLVSVPIEVVASKVHQRHSSQQQKSKLVKKASSMIGSLSAKTVSKIQYINNDDIIIQTGNTTISILINYQKILFFGYTSQPIPGQLFSYDSKHNLGLIASQHSLTVIKKSTNNSKNRCEQLARIDIAVSSLLLCGEIDVLFLGGRNGVISFVRWPEYFQNQSTTKHSNFNNKLYLFHSPIVSIQMSINYKQLFIVSQQGMVVICDLIHLDKLQKIGKDVSLRISKKVNFQQPLLNKWVVSISEGQRRAQKFTKMMGNEAEIKINETAFPQSYKLSLQKQLQDEKIRLDKELKSEIRRYQIEMGIQKLQLNIVLARDEIRSIIGKRESQSRELNEKIDVDLRKVFLDKSKLEKQLQQVRAFNHADKQSLLQSQHQQFTQRNKDHHHQSSQSTEIHLQSKNYYQQQSISNLETQQIMKQDFEDELKQTQMFYGGQMREIEEKNNVVGQENRSLKVEGIEMREKMREVDGRMQDLQVDLGEVEKQRCKVAQSKRQLSQKITIADINYQELINKNKQLQSALHKSRASSERCQIRYNQLQKQIQLLTVNLNHLEARSQQNQNNFVTQYNCRNVGMVQEEGLRRRISRLKERRKQVFGRNVLLKDLLKEYEKQAITQNQPLLPSQINESSLAFNRSRAHKLNYDIQKQTKLNTDLKYSTIRQSVRLNEQTSKLIFRYNELMRQHKQLVRVQNGLMRSIGVQRQKLVYSSTANNSSSWEKFSFVQVEGDDRSREEMIPKIRNCLSINNKRSSFSKDKLNYTTDSCFSPSLSRQGEINARNTAGKLKGLVKFQGEQTNNRLLKISKASSKNLHSAIYSKVAIQQLSKKPNTSLYHGVTLDPKTLKPTKTLCISLHQAGDETKFVTEY